MHKGMLFNAGSVSCVNEHPRALEEDVNKLRTKTPRSVLLVDYPVDQVASFVWRQKKISK